MTDTERKAEIASAAEKYGMLKASPTGTDATAFLRWYFRNHPNIRENIRGKDLYERTDGKRRWRIKKRVVEVESKGADRWIKVGSEPLIAMAQAIIAKNATEKAGEAVKKSAAKRASSQKKAEQRRTLKQREDELAFLGMKAVAAENPARVKAAVLRGDKMALMDLEAQGKRRGQLMGDYPLKGRELPTRDEWVTSLEENPPWLALILPVTYRWVQRMADGSALAIKVRHEGQNVAEVRMSATNQQVLGVHSGRLAIEVMDRFWNEEEIPVEHGYVTGRVQILRGRLVPVLTLIAVAGEKRKGSGTWLMKQWCRFVKSWGVDDFVIEAPGEEGQPFFDRLIARGDLGMLQKEGAYWRVACRFGATRSIPFDMFNDVAGYTPPDHIPAHGPRTWTLAASLRTAPFRVHVAAVALLGEMLSPFFEGDQALLHIQLRQSMDLLRSWDWLNHTLWKMAERKDALPTSSERKEARQILVSINDRWRKPLTSANELPMRTVLEMARFVHEYQQSDGHVLTARTIATLIKTLWGLRNNRGIDFGGAPLPIEEFNHILAEWWVYGPTRFSLKEGRRETVAGAPSDDCMVYNVHEPSMGGDSEFPFDRDIYDILEEACQTSLTTSASRSSSASIGNTVWTRCSRLLCWE